MTNDLPIESRQERSVQLVLKSIINKKRESSRGCLFLVVCVYMAS